MLQLLDFTGQNIIATKADDLLGLKDYEKIHPFIHNIINTGNKVRWYFEMDDDSNSGSTGFWEDGVIEINYGSMKFTHSDDIEVIAIVGDKKWEKCMKSIMKPFTKAKVVYFEMAEKEKAKAWIINNEK
ncbi:STAS/SEC14 domain-containing protein [Flavobacterium sp. UBA7682]|uniref:STAS/SEC14 domain-containing protein n=1 Tax=Flavobacterium sp. UBA7682 TaxID=1946560 RepID=UPI0025BDF7D2|nr:STAS/SEC14 domain-containing protein [Flavobacterium sp. UBA7682]